MNSLRKFLIGLFSLACFTAAAQEETPIIDIKTNSYAQNGESNVVTVLISGIKAGYIDVDCGFGLQEYELLARGFDESAGELTGTYVTCNVSKDGYIKIYGDATNIDMLNISGCYATDIEMSALVNLEVFNCEHNELKALDLTNNKKIVLLYMDDNPFTVSAPIIGEKPNLSLLQMGKTDKVDPDFNLSNYPAMVSFTAYANSGLTSIDPTGCPELQQLSIDVTPVSSIDVTKNEKLTILNVSDKNHIIRPEQKLKPYAIVLQPLCRRVQSVQNTRIRLEKQPAPDIRLCKRQRTHFNRSDKPPLSARPCIEKQ